MQKSLSTVYELDLIRKEKVIQVNLFSCKQIKISMFTLSNFINKITLIMSDEKSHSIKTDGTVLKNSKPFRQE